MANSRYEYVKAFEQEHYLLPECWLVVRVDGRGFHRFSDHYQFRKPNDERALAVMNQAAKRIVEQFAEVVLAYGDLDEYSFLLRRSTDLFQRREAKLVSTFGSTMTAEYIRAWSEQVGEGGLAPLDSRLPTFDARVVAYPSEKTVRDYFAWRQVDCHINNLYNTSFWALVQGGKTPKEAEERLKGTLASDKNELLWKEYGLNYNNEKEMFKKGTVIVRGRAVVPEGGMEQLSERQKDRLRKRLAKVEVVHVDIIGDGFWKEREWLLQ